MSKKEQQPVAPDKKSTTRKERAAKEPAKKKAAREAAKAKAKDAKEKSETAKINAETARLRAETKRNAAEAKLEALRKYICDTMDERVEELVKRRADKKLKDFVKQWKNVKTGKLISERQMIYFTCPQLIDMFGGWFTLSYAFSTKHMARGKGGVAVEVETPYYVCSQDISGKGVNDKKPEINEAVSKLVGKPIYGFALIAPAAAFGGRDEFEED